MKTTSIFVALAQEEPSAELIHAVADAWTLDVVRSLLANTETAVLCEAPTFGGTKTGPTSLIDGGRYLWGSGVHF